MMFFNTNRTFLIIGVLLCCLVPLAHGQDDELPVETFRNLSPQTLTKRCNKYIDMRWHPTELAVRVGNDQALFDVVFQKGKPQKSFIMNPSVLEKDFASLRKRRARTGWMPGITRPYQLKGQNYVAVAWFYDPPTNPLSEFWNIRKMTVTGTRVAELELVDELMTSFLIENRIPGAAIAISREGHMIYSRGFGYSNLDEKLKVQQKDTLFRISTLSQAITATAIIFLIDQGKLKVDQPVFELLNLRPFPENSIPDPRLGNITVRHLLYHASGFSEQKSSSILFRTREVAVSMKRPTPLNSIDLTRYLLGRKLVFDPGEKTDIAHTNYMILGRVIEAVSGKPYEKFVRAKILKPLGIRSMKIGYGPLEDRDKKEVVYYTQNGRQDRSEFNLEGTLVPIPYRYNMRLMDSTHGWIGTARDVLKFSDSFNDPSKHKFLSPDAAKSFFLPAKDFESPETKRHLGMGWYVDETQNGRITKTVKNGVLPGTSSNSTRRSDGINYVVLFNCKRAKNGKLANEEFCKRLDDLLTQIEIWPR